MEITKTRNGNDLTVSVAGRLDTVTSPELEAALANEFDGTNELILDFEKLDYISSAGLRVLLTAHKRMSRSGRLVIKNINETVGDVLEVTGFSDILNVE